MRIRAGAKAIRKGVMTRRNKARYVEHLLRAILDLPPSSLVVMEPSQTHMGGVMHSSFGNYHLMLLFQHAVCLCNCACRTHLEEQGWVLKRRYERCSAGHINRQQESELTFGRILQPVFSTRIHHKNWGRRKESWSWSMRAKMCCAVWIGIHKKGHCTAEFIDACVSEMPAARAERILVLSI